MEPSYMIFGGLVFVPLTQPFLHEWGTNWYTAAPRELVDTSIYKFFEEKDQQIVVLSQGMLFIYCWLIVTVY
jgi:hypothetical protein